MRHLFLLIVICVLILLSLSLLVRLPPWDIIRVVFIGVFTVVTAYLIYIGMRWQWDTMQRKSPRGATVVQNKGARLVDSRHKLQRDQDIDQIQSLLQKIASKSPTKFARVLRKFAQDSSKSESKGYRGQKEGKIGGKEESPK